jgi:hypothetical protein
MVCEAAARRVNCATVHPQDASFERQRQRCRPDTLQKVKRALAFAMEL